jgi:hypothetical protein
VGWGLNFLKKMPEDLDDFLGLHCDEFVLMYGVAGLGLILMHNPSLITSFRTLDLPWRISAKGQTGLIKADRIHPKHESSSRGKD